MHRALSSYVQYSMRTLLMPFQVAGAANKAEVVCCCGLATGATTQVWHWAEETSSVVDRPSFVGRGAVVVSLRLCMWKVVEPVHLLRNGRCLLHLSWELSVMVKDPGTSWKWMFVVRCGVKSTACTP